MSLQFAANLHGKTTLQADSAATEAFSGSCFVALTARDFGTHERKRMGERIENLPVVGVNSGKLKLKKGILDL
jgi:hypothetical protein